MLCQSEGSRIETPCSGQAPWATKELAHIGDLQDATQHMAEHPWSRRFPDGFGMGGMCVAGALVQGTGQLQGTEFCELGARLGVDAHFLPAPRCWGRKGGVCHVGWCWARIPHVTGMARPCRAAAQQEFTHTWRGAAQGSAEGCRSNVPHAEGFSSVSPVCLQQDKGVLPLSAALPGTGATKAALHSSDLWMFAHSCLLMCLITKSCQDAALLPPALARLPPPVPQLRIGTGPMLGESTGSPKEQNLC